MTARQKAGANAARDRKAATTKPRGLRKRLRAFLSTATPQLGRAAPRLSNPSLTRLLSIGAPLASARRRVAFAWAMTRQVIASEQARTS